MCGIRNEQKIKILVGFDQGVHNYVVGRDIVVHRSAREQEMPYQIFCCVLVGL
jgi:hypothetical protein